MQFQYQNTNLLSTNAVFQTAQSLTSYIIHLNDVINRSGYTDPECSINLSTDMDLLDNVNNAGETYSGQEPTANSQKPRFIIDIGIGGSNLGTKAVYDALYGHFDAIEPNRFPKMIFLDTNDETYIAKLVSFLSTITDPNDIVINAISKSGGTTETIANLEIVYQALMTKFPNIHDRVVITTDEGSKLEARAQELEIRTLSLPKLVGGRYSVLSAVGLFPLALCGLDINALRTGAEEMRRLCVSSNTANNPALLSATILYLHSQAGKTIHDTFTFLPQLESLGKWYRQLMGESIGKEHDITGAIVNAGMTPTVSVGSTDLHSVGQLYLGGPKDKVTTFIQSGIQELEARVPAQMQFPLVSSIEGKRASELMNAIREGVQIAYTKQQLPYMSLVFDGVDEKEIGAFFQFKMIEMMYLGKLFNVNTFDQPHVELYKTETKRILQK
jgi:glucose-6-phosphate isomerase